jgi:hypothetical protein
MGIFVGIQADQKVETHKIPSLPIRGTIMAGTRCLNDTFLKNLKGSDPKKHFDGGGLYLYLTKTGSKLWRMVYRFGGKEKTLSFGAYPAVSLKEATLNGR